MAKKKLTYEAVRRAVIEAIEFCKGNINLFSETVIPFALDIAGLDIEDMQYASKNQRLLEYVEKALIEYQEATNYYLKIDLNAKIPEEYMPFLQMYRETGEDWQQHIREYQNKNKQHPKPFLENPDPDPKLHKNKTKKKNPNVLRKFEVGPMFGLNVNNLKSDTLKQICSVLSKKNIPYVILINEEPAWPYHRFLIEVWSHSRRPFPIYDFDHPLCSTEHETSIFDDIHRERIDIAAKSSIEIRVKGQTRNGSNRIQFNEGQARVDEIKNVQVWELGDETILNIHAIIDPYVKKEKQK